MTVARHLDEAVGRLRQAELRIEAARAKPTGPENDREWLEGLSEYVKALADVNEYSTEILREQIEAVQTRLGIAPTSRGSEDRASRRERT